jgi:voltage-gated potassium channel
MTDRSHHLMKKSIHKVIFGASFFVASCVAAIAGYMLAGWTFVEAVYMVIITIFGVGYGEVRPIVDPSLRIFTMMVIITGFTSTIYFMGGLAQWVAESELYRFLGARRMTDGIEKLSNHVIVCGYGRVGRILAEELVRSKQQFVIIDTNQQRLQEAESAGMFVLVGDAIEEHVLESAGIARARVLATVLPDDTSNVFITLTARELNKEIEIIARGESFSTEKKLMRSGATRVILPAAIGASRIARLIARPTVEEMLKSELQQEALADDLEQIGLRMSEIRVPAHSDMTGMELSALSFGQAIQFVLIAIRSEDGSVQKDPPANYKLVANDTLIILARRNAEVELTRLAKPKERMYRGVRS